MIGGVTTAALIAGLAYFVELHDDTKSAAQTSEKLKILNAQRAVAGQGKGGGNLNVSFTSSSDNLVPGALNLIANISSTRDLSELRYEWLLPDGVTLTKGVLSGEIGTLADGDESTIEVSLSIPAIENKQVHLQVYRLVDGEKMGQVAQYNTIDQKSIDREMASKRETLEAESARAPASEKPKLME